MVSSFKPKNNYGFLSITDNIENESLYVGNVVALKGLIRFAKYMNKK